MRAALHASLAMVLATAASSALPEPATAQGDRSCSIDPVQVPHRPIRLRGTVVRPISPDGVRIATGMVEKTTGARISPDYADLPRVVVKVVRGQTTYETIAAVVDGHVPHPGDRVDVLSRYRDPRSPCDFIPWTIAPPTATS